MYSLSETVPGAQRMLTSSQEYRFDLWDSYEARRKEIDLEKRRADRKQG